MYFINLLASFVSISQAMTLHISLKSYNVSLRLTLDTVIVLMHFTCFLHCLYQKIPAIGGKPQICQQTVIIICQKSKIFYHLIYIKKPTCEFSPEAIVMNLVIISNMPITPGRLLSLLNRDTRPFVRGIKGDITAHQAYHVFH